LRNLPKIILPLLLLFVSVVPVTGKEQLQSDNRVVLIKAIPGCANREEFEAMIDLAQRRDAAGFAEYMASHNCPVLQAGTAAVYEDRAYSGRAVCVRRRGDASCLWIPSGAVQKPGRSVPSTVF
jgi:hypothetical protein